MNSEVEPGWEPLPLAISYCKPELVKEIVERGADVHITKGVIKTIRFFTILIEFSCFRRRHAVNARLLPLSNPGIASNHRTVAR